MTRNILIDVDDTIAETQRMLVETINQRLKADYRFEDMTRQYREDDNEVTKQWKEAVYKILKEPQTMAKIKPAPGALEAMERLVAAEFLPHIVSARQDPLHKVTEQWLKDYLFRDLVVGVHPRSSKERGEEFKIRVAKEVGFVSAFDDTYGVCVALAEVVPQVYVIDKPWNRGHDLPENAVRVKSFAAGVDEFLKRTWGYYNG